MMQAAASGGKGGGGQAAALDPAATREWAREARAAFEISPLYEIAKGERLQVGFELELFARIPAGLGAPEERVEALWDRLREIVESLACLLAAEGRIEIEPFDVADHLRPETQFAPEVALKARLFHGPDYLAASAVDESGHVKEAEARLKDLGLRARSW